MQIVVFFIINQLSLYYNRILMLTLIITCNKTFLLQVIIKVVFKFEDIFIKNIFKLENNKCI